MNRRMNMGRLAGFALLGATALSSLTGCSFIKGLTNPDVAWAMGEPSPMSVVVRRNELATGIADEVDRLMVETPVDEAAEEAFALSQADMTKLMNEAAGEPIYAGQPFKVVAAEAWLPTLARTCAEDDGHDTLVGMLEGDVEDQLADVLSQRAQLSKLEAEISAAEERRDEDGASESQRAKEDAAIAKLEEKVTALEDSYEPKVDELLRAVRTAAVDAPDKTKERMTPIVLNLLEAVEDARIANDAAMMRYPLAVPGLTSDLQQAATRFVADVIEERTGHRPSTQGIAPEVSLEGTDVKLGLNGVPAEALGDLDLAWVVGEVTDRTQAYAGRTFTLLGDAGSTADRLELQADLLSAWKKGLAAPSTMDGVVDITDVEVVAKAGAPGAKKTDEDAKEAAGKKRSYGGLSVERCATSTGPAVADKGDDDAKQPAKKAPVKTAKKPRKPYKGTGQPRQTASSKEEWIELPSAGGGPMLEGP